MMMRASLKKGLCVGDSGSASKGAGGRAARGLAITPTRTRISRARRRARGQRLDVLVSPVTKFSVDLQRSYDLDVALRKFECVLHCLGLV
jgi:hypothetical protein